MKYAIISEGIVENIVIADSSTAQENGWILLDDDNKFVEIGWSYDGNTFTKPLIDEQKVLEENWKKVRQKRDECLEQSDVFMLVDRFNSLTPEKQQEWIDYRQNLRDIPQVYIDPLEIVWPSNPA